MELAQPSSFFPFILSHVFWSSDCILSLGLKRNFNSNWKTTRNQIKSQNNIFMLFHFVLYVVSILFAYLLLLFLLLLIRLSQLSISLYLFEPNTQFLGKILSMTVLAATWLHCLLWLGTSQTAEYVMTWKMKPLPICL